jgi:hypothetical protein
MPKKASGRVDKEDIELAKAAKEKAGGPAALAKLFGVTSPAASEWGRTRPIPRHLRPTLQQYVRHDEDTAARAESAGQVQKLLSRQREYLERVRELLFGIPPDLEKLPWRYRERYRERLIETRSRVEESLTEITSNIERELADFKARLIAEYQARRSSS